MAPTDDPGVAMADDRPWVGATAATLAAWPDLAAPLVDALATGATPIPAVPAGVVNGLAAELADRMMQVAEKSAEATAADAAAQGVNDPSGTPDRDRIEHLAATFAGLIAAGYVSEATQAALGVPLTEAGRLKAATSAVAAAVRTALTALGTAVSGLVPTQVGAAMAAGEHEGARAVFEAHPPLYLWADEHFRDATQCEPCAHNDRRRYDTLAEALDDYPAVGYRLCRGGIRCRGRLRGGWGDAMPDTPRPALTEADVVEVHTGAMLALVPTAADAARLAVDGGEDADQLHLTLAYLGQAEAIDTATRQQLLDALTAAVNGLPVIDAAAFASALFNPAGDEPCRVILVGGDLLDGVHHFLMDVLRLPVAVDRHAPWIPHITLAYDGNFGRLAELADRMGPVRFDRVRLAFGGQNIDIPLDDDPAGEVDDDGDEPDGDWALVEAEDRNNLRTYFTVNPKGLRRWAGKPHPWTALFKILRKHLDPERAKRVTSAWYIRVFHHTPNQTRGKAPLAERYDPGQPRDHDGQWTGGAPGGGFDLAGLTDVAKAAGTFGDLAAGLDAQGDVRFAFQEQRAGQPTTRELDLSLGEIGDLRGELARLSTARDDLPDSPDLHGVYDDARWGDGGAHKAELLGNGQIEITFGAEDDEPWVLTLDPPHTAGPDGEDSDDTQLVLDTLDKVLAAASRHGFTEAARAFSEAVTRHREAVKPLEVRRSGAPMRSLSERFDPSQPRNPHTGEWSRVLAAAELNVGKAKLRLTHHGDGRVSVHDEHGGALHLTRDDLKGGHRQGGLRKFAFTGPVNTEKVGERDWLTRTEDRGGRPWTTAHAGLQKTHVAGAGDTGLHEPDEPYLNDRHTLHLPAGGKGVDDPEDLFARPGTSMTTHELHNFADTLQAFSDGHEDVDTGHGHVTMGVNGKDFTFNTGKRGEKPIVLNRGEVRNINKALNAAYDAYNPEDGDPLPAGEHFKQTIPTKRSGDIIVTRTGPDSDFWIESDFTAIRVTPSALTDVVEHLDDLLALSGEVKHLTPVPVRPVTEARAGSRVDLIEAGRIRAF